MERKRGRRQPRNRYRPSEYIQHIKNLPPSTLVILYVRVSSARQEHASQLAALKAAAEAAGLVVVGVHVLTTPAGEAEGGLFKAAKQAEAHGATLLAECTSRFARAATHHAAHAHRRSPGRWAIKEVCDICRVPLATVLDPDATAAQERAYQMKRGQEGSGNYGGRPAKPRPGDKKQRRLKLLPRVLRMRLVGYSNRAIGRELEVPERTIRDWLKRCDT